MSRYDSYNEKQYTDICFKTNICHSIATTIMTTNGNSAKLTPTIPTTQYTVSPNPNAAADSNSSTTSIVEAGN